MLEPGEYAFNLFSLARQGYATCVTGGSRVWPLFILVTGSSSLAAAAILVVDDEVQVLSFITELLHMQGYDVDGTWDPDEALRLARTHPAHLHG